MIPADAARPREIGVLLFERFSNHCLANAVEPLRAANGFLERPAYRWRIATLDGGPATSSSGLTVQPEDRLDGLEGGELLMVMPSYGFRRLATPACAAALRRAARRFQAIAALDTGAWLLAAAGLLDGRAATIHFDAFDAFELAFPAVDARRERWLIDGDRLSAAGAAASYELILQVIERTYGVALTLEIAALFMTREVGDRAQPDGGAARRGGDPRVAAAITLMSANVEAPLDMAAIAAQVGCRPRDLTARFARALGAAPRAVYQRLRLTHARRLIETTELSVTEIGLRCGYQNASAFTRAFRSRFGRPPQSLRR